MATPSACAGAKVLKVAASKCFLTGSFWNAAAPMAAALAMEIIERDAVIPALERQGQKLIEGMLQLGQAHGIPLQASGPPAMPYLRVANDPSFRAQQALCAAAIQAGLYLHPHHNWFISAAHSPEIIETSLERFAQALQTFAAGQKIRMAKWCVWACISPLFFTALLANAPSSSLYQIHAQAPAPFANQDALLYTRALLAAHPAIKQRMRIPEYAHAQYGWSYGSQVYGSEATMLHLIALQIKSMAEAQAIHSESDLLDPQYGIGSRTTKTRLHQQSAGNLGHPIQQALFERSNPLTLHSLYRAFRKSIKIPYPFRPAAKPEMASAKQHSPAPSCYQLFEDTVSNQNSAI